MTDEGRDIERRARTLAAELDLGDVVSVTTLDGGVASDIASIDFGDRRLCMKFALPKLKTAADWFAPVHRNRAEYAWLSFVADRFPGAAPTLHGRSERLMGFAMEFVAGDDVFSWKAALLDGEVPRNVAARVGDLVGRIHRASASAAFDAVPFDNGRDFAALRTDPYLRATARAHPSVADRLRDLADGIDGRSDALIHGDVSPKNVMVRTGRPVLLDAECATMGDASFDPAFCLNHLVLKAAHLPGCRDALMAEAAALWSAYAAHLDPPVAAARERRAAHLVPALMLARVDGVSPVEYLAERARAQVRTTALSLLRSPEDTLEGLSVRLEEGFCDA